MTGTPDRIATLLFKYLQNTITETEREELDAWIAASAENRLQFTQLTSQANIRAKVIEMDGGMKHKQPIWDSLVAKIPELVEAPVRRLVWVRYAAAAAIIIMFLGGASALYYYKKQPAKNMAGRNASPATDVLPGGNRAVLTLANGTNIILDSASNGTISQQGNANVVKTNDGRIAYKVTGNNEEPVYNLITTRRGDQYQVVLPDGTIVWLNAASSLKYPTAFVGKERVVELTGEAYFEVAPLTPKGGSGKVPFRVIINPPLGARGEAGSGGEVLVLGTHFNINAYPDEAGIKTTLLEGSVKVSPLGSHVSQLLLPGQQAVQDKNAIQIIKDANTEEAVAWKNGVFQFNGASIETVMRQVARWYDVDVVYEGKITQVFEGDIPRNVPVSKLFKMLEATGRIKLRVADRKIMVMPAK